MTQRKRQSKKPRSHPKPKAAPKTTKGSSAPSENILVLLLRGLSRTCCFALGAAVALLGSCRQSLRSGGPTDDDLRSTSSTPATHYAWILQKAGTLLATGGGLLRSILPWRHERTSRPGHQGSLDDSSKPLLGSSESQESDESTEEQRAAEDGSPGDDQAVTLFDSQDEPSQGNTHEGVPGQPLSVPSGSTEEERLNSLEPKRLLVLSRRQAVDEKLKTAKGDKHSSNGATEVAKKSACQPSQPQNAKRAQVKKTVKAGSKEQSNKEADLGSEVPKTVQSIGRGGIPTDVPSRTAEMDSDTMGGIDSTTFSGIIKEKIQGDGRNFNAAVKVAAKSGRQSSQLRNTKRAPVKKITKAGDQVQSNKKADLGAKVPKTAQRAKKSASPAGVPNKAQNKNIPQTELTQEAHGVEEEGLRAKVPKPVQKVKKDAIPIGVPNKAQNRDIPPSESTKKAQRVEKDGLNAKVPKTVQRIKKGATPLAVPNKAKKNIPRTELTKTAQRVEENGLSAQIPKENGKPKKSQSLTYMKHKNTAGTESSNRDGTEGTKLSDKTKEGPELPDLTVREKKSKRKSKTKSESDLISPSPSFSKKEVKEPAKHENEQGQNTSGKKVTGWLPDKFCAYVRLADSDNLPEVLVNARKIQDGPEEHNRKRSEKVSSFPTDRKHSLVSTIKQIVRLCSKMLHTLTVDETGAKDVEDREQNGSGLHSSHSVQGGPESNGKQKPIDELIETVPPHKSSKVPDGTPDVGGRSAIPPQPRTKVAGKNDHTRPNSRPEVVNNKGTSDSNDGASDSSIQRVPDKEPAGDESTSKMQDPSRQGRDQLNSATFNWKTNSLFSSDKGFQRLESNDKPFDTDSTNVSKPNGNREEDPPTSIGGSDKRSLQHPANDQAKAPDTSAKTPHHSEFSTERQDAGPKRASPVGKLDRSRKKLWEKAEPPAAPPSRLREQHSTAAYSAQPAPSAAGGCCDPPPRDGFWPCQQGRSGKVKGLVQTYEAPRRKPRGPSLVRR